MYRLNLFLSPICFGQKTELFFFTKAFILPPLGLCRQGPPPPRPSPCPLTPLVNGKPSVTQTAMFSDTESLNAKQEEVLQFKVMTLQLA
jgi:hypothetical protein